MSEKELAPTLRFKGFTDAWKQSSLNENVSYITSTLSISDARKKGKYPLFDANNTIGFCSDKFVNQDYITIIKDGAGVGRVRLLPKYSYFIGTMGAMVPKNSDLNFDYALLEKTNFSNHIRGTTIPHIYFSDYGNMEIKICSLQEQTLIGNVFSSLDSIITLHQRKYEELQNAKKSLLQKMFPEGNGEKPSLRFKGFTDAWEQHKLKELGSTYAGLFGKNSSNFGHGDARFVPYLNIFNNPITDLNFLEKTEIDNRQSEVKKGDIFFTTSSETPDEVGMSSVWTGTDSCVYLNSFCFGFRPRIKLDNNYMAFLLRSQSMREKIVFLAQGISRYNISKNKMMDIEVPLPLKDEQIKIGALLKDLDSLITLHQRKCEKLQNIKKSLLERMFI